MEREEAGATPRRVSRGSSLTKVGTVHEDVNIPLGSLPHYVQEKLAAFDANADGFISLSEILRHGAELEHARSRNTTYRRLLVVLVIVWLASLAAVFGVVTGGVVVTRQSIIPAGTSALTTRDGDTVVQTVPFSATMQASSAMPDDFWQGLTHLTLVAPNDTWLRMAVQATARIQGPGAEGSVIKARACVRACMRACVLRAPGRAALGIDCMRSPLLLTWRATLSLLRPGGDQLRHGAAGRAAPVVFGRHGAAVCGSGLHCGTFGPASVAD